MFRKGKIHRFYLNFVFCVAIILGFVVANVVKTTALFSITWLFFAIFLFVVSWIFSTKICLILIFASGMIISGWRTSVFNFENYKIANFENSVVLVRGIIFEDPDFSENGEVKIKIQVEKINKSLVSGRIFTTIKTDQKIRRSDEIEIRGKISPGFGAFSAAIYRGEISKIVKKQDLARDTRDFFANKIRKIIPYPEVDLGLGYVLGQKNSLPEELSKALKITALTHIVVASGYNLAILVSATRKIFEKISRKLALLFGVILVLIFMAVVGFSPSMVRAGIVSILGISLWYFGRKSHTYFLITFVAAATLLANPANLFDLGWQLSFGSFFGVMILAPLLEKFLFEKPEKLGVISSIFFETLSVQIATVPIILLNFGEFSLISIFANLLILPLIPISMFLTFLAGVFAVIFTPMAKFFGIFAEAFLKTSIFIIEQFSKIPNSQIELKINEIDVIFSYILIFSVVIFLEIKTREKWKNNEKNDKM